MRRTEAFQGVRMIKLRGVLDRYEASEFSQLEAAELLGMGERTFRRWRRRFESEGEAGLLDRRPGAPARAGITLGRSASVATPTERDRDARCAEVNANGRAASPSRFLYVGIFIRPAA